jgi:SNF2 family DNA or RNA helicase
MDEITPAIVTISYNPARLSGRFTLTKDAALSSIWQHLKVRAYADPASIVEPAAIEMPWPSALDIIREFGSKSSQRSLVFRFAVDSSANALVSTFAAEVRAAKSARDTLKVSISIEEIKAALKAKGFTKRELKQFQLRDLQHLLSLPHGANFSVPGAGKTSVAFALHLLTRQPGQYLLVIAPKAAFPAWREIVDECMGPDAPDGGAEQFTVLDGRDDETDKQLRSGRTRFVMSYDLMVRQQAVISTFLARQPVHVILDEAHRMKAGALSQRGAFLISVANLPVRRDILTGTPMPQDANDLASQLQFLWPGHGLELQIQRGITPSQVLGQLFVRTTKTELGLPPSKRHYYQVEMSPAQLALYSIVRDETLRQLTKTIKTDLSRIDFLSARRSVLRLLQLSVNPTIALRSLSESSMKLETGLIDRVVEEGASPKMRIVAEHARTLAHAGNKTVLWTIFTNTIHDMEVMLADLNPVLLYGQVPTGEPTDPDTREGRIRRFHNDPHCSVLIANPAAAGEGISLHTVCHNAIYLDRSYVSTHYLQSIDRIHRLGLPPDQETNIHIYESKAPAVIGSIDLSVRRRLAQKIRGLQQLLNDADLHELAFDEENADDPTSYNVDLQDLIDLVEELEGSAPEAPLE